MRLDVVPAKRRHAAALAQLEVACFDPPWSRDQLASELAKDGCRGWVAHQVPSAVGYVLFSQVVDEAELLRLAVLPAARGGGAADALLRKGLSDLAVRGIRTCHLEVAATNHRALAVYRRHGFTPVGRRRAYYSNGADAVLMSRRLPEPP